MLLTATVFSLVAAFLIMLAGRKDPARALGLTATSIALLLLFPLLTLLPKLKVLPASTGDVAAASGGSHVLTWIWISGVLLFGIRLLRAALLLHRWKSASVLIRRELTAAGRSVEIRELSFLESPVAAGCIQPVVFLPSNWRQWHPREGRAVIAHELAHHQRRDPLWRLLAALACAIHWFNPLAWWLAKRHADQSEFACDAMVVAGGIPPDRYAHLLCDLASSSSPSALAPAMSQSASLAARVSRLMAHSPPVPRWLHAILLGTTILTALGLSMLREARPPAPPVPADEVILRLSADPFPGNP